MRSCFAKLRLSSHKFMSERGGWSKPKVEYVERICTLCDERDIQDEYHIIIKCTHFSSLRHKYILRDIIMLIQACTRLHN